MNKLILTLLILSFLLASCARPPIIIHFKDGGTAFCSRVEVRPDFTTCIHATTFSETVGLFRTDTIERFSQ